MLSKARLTSVDEWLRALTLNLEVRIPAGFSHQLWSFIHLFLALASYSCGKSLEIPNLKLVKFADTENVS
jgi:hypothetical protein